ncbi:MAG TPA: alpha/beta fold hydrolase [Solirubrobacteraceae bacterium]|nr:alpha/beta fold hydrolase [Solirubrobacteraceae bacterium]
MTQTTSSADDPREPLGEPREVRLEQGTIRYRERGSGPTIVFIHGLLVHGGLWRKVVPELERDFRCVVPDLPLGSHDLPLNPDADRSPPGIARLIADFVAALELQDVTLVGNDTGGALSQMVIANHPERIGRLVLTPCDAYENFLPPAFRPLQWLAHVPGALTALVQPARLAAIRRSPLGYGVLTVRPIDAAVTESYVRPFLRDRGVRRDTVAFLRKISPRDTLAAADHFAEFDRPVLIAWAPKDRFFKLKYAERMLDAFPNARLEKVEDALTFVSEDQPERLAELIAAFVREPAPAATAAP